MKTKSKELDVDFIGGQGSLTKDEERKISEYLKSQKLQKSKKQFNAKKTSHSRNLLHK